MASLSNNFSFLRDSALLSCPITKQRVPLRGLREFLTSSERTIWWYCQTCDNWHIFTHDSPVNNSMLNAETPDNSTPTTE